jgi:hypothetical protein
MSQPPALPQTPSPTPSAPAAASTLTWRNWWRNGFACRVAVVLSILIVLNLFQPWSADVTGMGYSSTETSGGVTRRYWHEGTKLIGQDNAFARNMGWIPLLLMLGNLWVCATPRVNWGAMRWLPMISALIVTAIVFFGLLDLQREWDAFNAKLSTKAIVTYPAAMQGIFFLGILLAISGAFLARKPRAASNQ